MGLLRISKKELQEAEPASYQLWVMLKLIEAGAPLKVTRENKLDVSELKETEIIFTGIITRTRDLDSGDIIYTWGCEE